MRRIVVTGGRDFCDAPALVRALDAIYAEGPFRLAQGGARGADGRARDWASARGVGCVTYAADWQRYGRAAGVIRNREMLQDFAPDLVVAFPGGRGTQHCCDTARKMGITIIEVPT